VRRILADGQELTLEIMSDSTELNSRDYPSWMADGGAAIYEANPGGGVNDATVRSLFDDPDPQTPGDREQVLHAVMSEVNEFPVAFQNPSHPITKNMMFYAKSNGEIGYPRLVHRLEAGDPDDVFLTVGFNVNWMGTQGEHLVYLKHVQGFPQIFRSRWDGETLDHRISVLVASGSGGFLPKSERSVLRGPSDIVAGDFDGNGTDDVWVACPESPRLALLTGNGQGLLSRGRTPAPTGSGPFDVAASDLDDNDTIDLVEVQRNANLVRILSNAAGDGVFVDASSFAVGSEPVAVAIGDFNGDSFPDLAVANRASDEIRILLRNGALPLTDSGAFQAGAIFSPGDKPSDIVAGDMNLDGKLDLTISLEGESSITVWGGDGAGGFTHGTTISPIIDPNLPPLALKPSGLALMDLDWRVLDENDPNFVTPGPIDIVASNLIADTVFVWKNLTPPGSPTFTFSLASVYQVGSKPTGVTIADVTGDTILDIITANMGDNTGTVLPGLGQGVFDGQGAITVPTGAKPWKVIAGRFLGDDAFTDLAFPCGDSDTLALVERNPQVEFLPSAPAFRLTTSLPTGRSPRNLATADFDGDGCTDLVSADFLGDGLTVLRRFMMLGSTSIDPQSYVSANDVTVEAAGTIGHQAVALASLDFNKALPTDTQPDGRLDLVVATLGAGTVNPEVAALRGDGAGGMTKVYQESSDLGSRGFFTAVATGDFTGDGFGDFAALSIKGTSSGSSSATTLQTGQLRIYHATPDSPSGPFELQGAPIVLANPGDQEDSEDVRGPRFLVATPSGQTLYAVCGLGGSILRYQNDGNGAFTRQEKLVVGFEPRQLALGDFDGNGHLDGALTLSEKGKVLVFLAQNGTTFLDVTPVELPPDPATIPPGAYAITTGLFDGNASLDLAVTSVSDGTANIFLNDGSGGFTLTSTHACGPGPVRIAATRLNGDTLDDLVVANAFGEADEILTNRTAQYGHPVGSPDGNKVAFCTTIKDGSGTTTQIAYVDVRLSFPAERVVTSLDVNRGPISLNPDLVWGPESRRLFYPREANPLDPMVEPAGGYMLRVD
jgi:hypothetical protein